MTTKQLSAHYRACMEKEVAEICKKRLGALPKNASEEKVGLFARKRVADERSALCRELRGCFDVSLNGGESLGYDELCTAIWGEIEERVPYWQWIVRFCKDRGSVRRGRNTSDAVGPFFGPAGRDGVCIGA